jgi:hypothetical protein
VIVAGRDVGREGAEGVERCLVAPIQLVAHVLGNLVQRDVPWALQHRNRNNEIADMQLCLCIRRHHNLEAPRAPGTYFVHYLHVLLPSAFGQFSLGPKLSELRFIVGVVDAPGTQPVADAEGDVVLGANVKDVVPVCDMPAPV